MAKTEDTPQPTNRLPTGRFAPGKSGNPHGRPRSRLESILACRALNEETLAVLVSLMRDSKVDKVRAECAMRIRDEANGKPCSMADMPREEHEQAPLDNMPTEQLVQMAIDMGRKLNGVEN